MSNNSRWRESEMKKRKLFCARCLAILFASAWFSLAQGAIDLELTQGVNAALPIAVLPFGGQDNATTITENMAVTIATDLANSGRFKLIENNAQAENSDAHYWREQGANNIISGSIEAVDDGQLAVSFQLLDPIGQQSILLNSRYRVNPDDLRRLAHHISDLIYQELTGDQGIFSTHIAYIVAQIQADESTEYRLEVADADGYNPQSLLTSTDPIMSPAWSADGQDLAYVSFENKRAQIFIVNIASGDRRLVTRYPGINGAPAWSPDKQQLALVLSKDGYPNLYALNLRSKRLRQLTNDRAISTEPSWSPDGKTIVFTSDRGGSPQIYQLNVASGATERMTFTGDYNASASYTPDGNDLVLLHQDSNGRFNIALHNIASNTLFDLSRLGKAESPSIAPNGKMVLYAIQEGERTVLHITSIDGRVQLRLPSREGNVQEPAWSPFLDA